MEGAMKTVLITYGDSWDHTHEAFLEIPDDFTENKADSLYKEFEAKYFSEKKALTVAGVTPTWEAQQEYMQRMVAILQAAGYTGLDEIDLFIDWLCKEHGCKSIPFEEWHY